MASPLLLGHSKPFKSLDSEMEEQTGLSNSLPLADNSLRSPNKFTGKINKVLGERKREKEGGKK